VIVSHRHRFVFVKTRRTGGSSVEAALAPHLGPEDAITGSARDGTPRRNCPDGLTGHVGRRRIRRLFGATVEDYLWFCVERNSYAKAASDWRWHRHVLRDTDLDPAAFVLARRPSDWPRYTEDGRPAATVLRFEGLGGAFASVCADLGLPPLALPHLKRTAAPASARTGLTGLGGFREPAPRRRFAAAVAEVFANEIAHFGYGA